MNTKLSPTINNKNNYYSSRGFVSSAYPPFDTLLDMFFRKDLLSDINIDPEWKENPDSYNLKLKVPGFKAEEVNVNFNNGKFTINAESKRDGDENAYSKELYTSYFESVDFDKANAKLEDGVLLITLPKIEKSKDRKIKVE